jgi:1-acyl-sn-glycerol-3-phosphate acyltransferase
VTDYATNKPAPPSWDANAYHGRTLERGASRVLYWIVRAVLQPAFHVYFRLSRYGIAHVPKQGPVIFASNHRSFLDALVLGTLVRRPVYYVAKKEHFLHPVRGRVMSMLGAFPVDRGAGDTRAMDTARAILERGDCVCIFPEGTRTRPGPLGSAHRGVGRLALQTGAPVVPGGRARHGGRPPRLADPARTASRLRCGAPADASRVDGEPHASRETAAVTDRIWPRVDAAVGLARREGGAATAARLRRDPRGSPRRVRAHG